MGGVPHDDTFIRISVYEIIGSCQNEPPDYGYGHSSFMESTGVCNKHSKPSGFILPLNFHSGVDSRLLKKSPRMKLSKETVASSSIVTKDCRTMVLLGKSYANLRHFKSIWRITDIHPFILS